MPILEPCPERQKDEFVMGLAVQGTAGEGGEDGLG